MQYERESGDAITRQSEKCGLRGPRALLHGLRLSFEASTAERCEEGVYTDQHTAQWTHQIRAVLLDEPEVLLAELNALSTRHLLDRGASESAAEACNEGLQPPRPPLENHPPAATDCTSPAGAPPLQHRAASKLAAGEEPVPPQPGGAPQRLQPLGREALLGRAKSEAQRPLRLLDALLEDEGGPRGVARRFSSHRRTSPKGSNLQAWRAPSVCRKRNAASAPSSSAETPDFHGAALEAAAAAPAERTRQEQHARAHAADGVADREDDAAAAAAVADVENRRAELEACLFEEEESSPAGLTRVHRHRQQESQVQGVLPQLQDNASDAEEAKDGEDDWLGAQMEQLRLDEAPQWEASCQPHGAAVDTPQSEPLRRCAAQKTPPQRVQKKQLVDPTADVQRGADTSPCEVSPASSSLRQTKQSQQPHLLQRPRLITFADEVAARGTDSATNGAPDGAPPTPCDEPLQASAAAAEESERELFMSRMEVLKTQMARLRESEERLRNISAELRQQRADLEAERGALGALGVLVATGAGSIENRDTQPSQVEELKEELQTVKFRYRTAHNRWAAERQQLRQQLQEAKAELRLAIACRTPSHAGDTLAPEATRASERAVVLSGEAAAAASASDLGEGSADPVAESKETPHVEAPCTAEDFASLLSFDFSGPFVAGMETLREILSDRNPPVAKKELKDRVEQTLESGHIRIVYSNGLERLRARNGQTFVLFLNGDIRITEPGGAQIYQFRESNTLQYNLADGRQFNRFSDGQLECLFPDGSAQIIFANGIRKIVGANREEKLIFPDGSTQLVTAPAASAP
ncbi:t-complex protein 10 c-terminus protein [Cyclospora cayetanensis]|uniref:T-complex protein 10 c-terminus protein n=1 Tax=Cyclospora cayetanensis TaxID=88456 RepID=A0A1D3CUU0_9EIME|nr:t-complex protein 10 c-terminus protein [Cyclospora cayetanensis]